MHGSRDTGLAVMVSSSNPDPMYKQVTDQIKDAIIQGVLATEAKLPSIRDLAGSLKLSPITVKRAYSDLEHEGYIVTRPGLGSFVAAVNTVTLRDDKIKEVRRELVRILRMAKAFGIPLSRIRMLVNEMWPR